MSSSRARPRTVMLVSNPCVNDSRVIRAAEVVSELGHEVVVLAVVMNDENADEHRNGVYYRRLRLKRVLLPHHFLGSERSRPSKRRVQIINHHWIKLRHWINTQKPSSSSSKQRRVRTISQHWIKLRDWINTQKASSSPSKQRRVYRVKATPQWRLPRVPRRWSNFVKGNPTAHAAAISVLGTVKTTKTTTRRTVKELRRRGNKLRRWWGKELRRSGNELRRWSNKLRRWGRPPGSAVIKAFNQTWRTTHSLKSVNVVVIIGRETVRTARTTTQQTVRTLRRLGKSTSSVVGKAFKTTRDFSLRHFGFLVEVNRLTDIFADELERLSPDVIHAHDLSTLPAASMVASRIKAKVVYDSHELEVHRNMVASRCGRWLRRRIEAKYIRKADAVVTVCGSIADHLAEAYKIPRPLVVMNAPNVFPAYKFDRDLRTDIGLSQKTPLAVYIGRITLGRGIEECVKALPHWPNGHIALVGPTHPPTVASALALARELNVMDRLHLMPPVPPDSVTSYVRTADISLVAIQNVCLSYYYCLPNKLIESALAGLPVVVSNFPELRRFVEISGNGLIMDERDPHDIARALSDVYVYRDKLKSSPEQLTRVEAIYGWSTQKRVLEELYRSFGLPSPVQKRRAKKGVAGGKVALAQAADKADYFG